MTTATTDALKLVRHHLHTLHSAFLESLRYRYELKKGQPVNAYAWFNVVTQDPDYTWIKPFNEVVMDLDILLENGRPNEEDAATVRLLLDALFVPSEGNLFATKFLELLVNDPDLMLNFHHFKSAREKITLAELKDKPELIRARWRAENQINSRALARKNNGEEH